MADVIITSSGGTGTKTYYDTDICNMALARIGNADNYLTSTMLTNNSNKEARLCNLHYAHVLRLAMAKMAARYSLVRDEISCDGEADYGKGYNYEFSLPDDCLLVIDVSDEPDAANTGLKWTREGRIIYCESDDTLYITYVSSDKTSDEMDVQFIEYLVVSLALAIAPSLVVNEAVLMRLKADRTEALVMAASIEGKEGYAEDAKSLWTDAGR